MRMKKGKKPSKRRPLAHSEGRDRKTQGKIRKKRIPKDPHLGKKDKGFSDGKGVALLHVMVQ